MDIKIVAAKLDQTYMDEFCSFQQKYSDKKFSKGFLPPQVWRQFLVQTPEPMANFWLAYLGDRPAGRIGASLMPSHKGLGSIGFFELDTSHKRYGDIAQSLLKQATSWLKSRSCHKAVGPMNLNTWFPYRFRSDEEVKRRYSWEPIHPQSYLDEWLGYGFSVNARYKAFNTGELGKFVATTQGAYEHCLSEGYHFRDFDAEYFFDRDIPILYEMSMECFKDNHLFEPISLEAFKSLYVPIADKMDHSLGQICFAKDGSPAGFGFSFIDDDAFVVKTLATMPQHRGHGISNALAYIAGTTAYERGMRSYITAIIHAGAQSESYGKKGELIWEHNYDLLEIEF